MSVNSARIVCTGCGYETREVYRPIRVRYQTANGKIVATGRSKGWCFNCASYSDVEGIDAGQLHARLMSKELERSEKRTRLAELDRGLLAGWRNRSERQLLHYELKQLAEALSEVVGMLEIVRSRKSNARCLKCWSDRTARVSFDSRDNIAHDFVHECGGNLQIIHDGSGPRINFRLTTLVLNEEGRLISTE